ncbi:E3 ubiquitin-protein ligase KCMF1-like isoform X1 [Leptotrombidium deliense]|uniref:RING-type E3 ubiquitin transferase n=1 Tax=Leptotrombidium deliense TaxID=299467 RepID=A0A443SU45_9ACAR|nr:E3 ubiquitin-protein ligase KCMF1-like isoform X1 [Leptotrombidium deliense]
MSHHEGVSCDSCEKNNFRGKRYKCLVCFDYDLCSTCYESGASSSRHTSEHPMQCILTRSDCELFFGGEAITTEAPQSFACPFCGKMGFMETNLQEHVTAEHGDANLEVVCPICASLPGGEPNHVTDDFATHLTLEHRSPRELISFLAKPQSSSRGRRVPHPSRGMNSARARRTQMHFSSSSGLSSLSPGNRESMDPIAELLSQLSGVRRAANLGQSHSSQLQQLQMQLQFERQSSGSARQSFERMPIERVTRRHQQTAQSQGQQQSSTSQAAVNGGQTLGHEVLMEPSPSPSTLAATAQAVAQANNSVPPLSYVTSNTTNCQFLLSTCNDLNLTEVEQQAAEVQKVERCLIGHELTIKSLKNQNSDEELNFIATDLNLEARETDLSNHRSDDDVCNSDVTASDDTNCLQKSNENERPKHLHLSNTGNVDPNLNTHLLNNRQERQVLRNSTQHGKQRSRTGNANSRGNVNSDDNSNINVRGSTSPSSSRRKVMRHPNESSQH